MEFKDRLNQYINEIDKHIKELFPKDKDIPNRIIQAMDYSVFAGGKRLRPILLIEGAKSVGGNLKRVVPLACALEMIHTYSLIHDDLPAMDNDDFRRGKPTNHRVFGEGMAVLAGDGLLNYSYELMINNIPDHIIDMKNYIGAMKEIAKAAGVMGMIGGQVKDLEYEGKSMDISILHYIHNHKTGALIRAAIRAGALASGANEKELTGLTIYGEKLGLAFQIVDDILDIIGDENKLGKPIGSDKDNNKFTYPYIYGIDKSKEIVDRLLSEAIEEISIFGSKADFLKELGVFICKRDY